MKRSIAIIIACYLSFQLSAQTAINMGTVAGKPVELKPAAFGMMSQLPLQKGEVEGDVYLNPEWALFDVLLTDNKTLFEGIPVKLNLQANEFEIKYQNEVKLLSGTLVKEFTLKNPEGSVEKYVNGKYYHFNSALVRGFLQRIDSGKWELLVKCELSLVKSNYNAALAVGDRNDKFVKVKKAFIANSKNNTLYETRMSRKEFSKIFKENEQRVNSFIKENKINLKKLEDLKVLVKFLNEEI